MQEGKQHQDSSSAAGYQHAGGAQVLLVHLAAVHSIQVSLAATPRHTTAAAC
jgi:hypothetical protein